MEIKEIYEKIVALKEEGVWVPAVENGGLKGLLESMAERGWEIIPPPFRPIPPAGFGLCVVVSDYMGSHPEYEGDEELFVALPESVSFPESFYLTHLGSSRNWAEELPKLPDESLVWNEYGKDSDEWVTLQKFCKEVIPNM